MACAPAQPPHSSALPACTACPAGEFRARLAAGTALDSLLVEAFAVVREAARRVMGMRHFDCQLVRRRRCCCRRWCCRRWLALLLALLALLLLAACA